MSHSKWLAAALLLSVLIGCTSEQEETAEVRKTEENTKAQMVGMSETELFTCMGTPEKKSTEGAVEIWSYSFGTCVVHLTIASDHKVKTVAYNTKPDPKAKPSDEPLTLEQQCAQVPMVASCTRWLRN